MLERRGEASAGGRREAAAANSQPEHGGEAGALRAILLGPPGAGKGTQAARICEVFDIPHVSTGNILRDNVQRGTQLGAEAKKFMDAGELVPDDVVVAMVGDRLQQPDAGRGFVLDGFPRTLPQAQALEDLLVARDMVLDVVVRMAIDEAEVIRRLTGRRTCTRCGTVFHVDTNPPTTEAVCDACGGEVVQRDDDKEDVVVNRLEVYRRQTEPLEYFYWQRGLLRDVEAVGDVDAVTARTLEVLREYRSQT